MADTKVVIDTSPTNVVLKTNTSKITIGAEQGPPGIIALTTNGNNGASTLTNSVLNIPTPTLAGLGGINYSSLSANTPLSYNSTTGTFSIQQASNTQSGYLSSSDWATFNSKQNALGYTPVNKAGDTFTGNITAPNLSGTNTGDETQTTILTKIGYTPENTANKSNSTSDSSSSIKYPTWYAISGYVTSAINGLSSVYAAISGANFTGNISAPNLSGTNTGDNSTSITGILKGNGNTISSAVSNVDYQSANYIFNATGAVSRSITSKLSDVISVKDFGAAGDGITDDTAAIQNAINALSSLGGGDIIFPSGTYSISTTITLKSNLKLKGLGLTKLKKSNYGSLMTVINISTASIFDITIEGKGDGSSNLENGLVITNSSNIHVEKVVFNKFNDEGLILGSGTIVCKVINCYGGNLCLNYSRSSRTGTISIAGTDHQIINNEFGSAQNYLPNGATPGNGNQSITSTNLYNCAYYITGSNCFFIGNRGQNSDVAFWIDSSSSGLHRMVNNRGDQCWAYSLRNEAPNSVITNHFAENVSLQGTNTYPAIYTSGQNNRYVNCHGRAINRGLGPTFNTCYPSYAYYDTVAAGLPNQKNNYINCTGVYDSSNGALVYTTSFEGSSFQTPMLSNRQSTTTIDVRETSFIVLNHTSNTDITTILGGSNGQQITILASLSSFNTVVRIIPSSNIKTISGPLTIPNNQVVNFVCYNNTWYQYINTPIAKGATTDRPNSYSTAGLQFFDTTLNKPIWRNAANTGWIDATGNNV